MSENTCIKVCSQEFDTGTRVVLWDEQAGHSFYPFKKFHARNWSLEEAREKINSFYIHHSVTYLASHMYGGLKARGLSCNFMIDDDINEDTGCATIYQCLDVKDAGWSQGSIYNHNGAGVELSYFPDAWTKPDRYSPQMRKKYNLPQHPIMPDTIHGHKFNKVYGPTEAQVKACIQLIRAYSKAFPNLKLEFPKDDDNKFITTVAPVEKQHGLLHHYHVKRGKIDAMGFPTEMVEVALKELVERERSGVIIKPTSKLSIAKWFEKK